MSEIDDPSFFFAKNGKESASSELNATLEALYNERSYDDNATGCKFPARKAWLQQRLQLKDLPEVDCKKYKKTMQKLAPRSATLVFPSAHINSPASMFGHTFLRINSKYKSKLLAYAVNYAANANPDKENAVLFALKGLFGGYYGQYSLLPYYEKLKEYRDSEQRDIWEYDLNLTEEEVLRMVNHIWELNGTYSDYFFFSENCSYNMLWLLEVARPSLHLREEFFYQVTPLESVYVVQKADLIHSNSFRASKRTLLLKYENIINPNYLHLVKEMLQKQQLIAALSENEEIPLEQKCYLFEAAIEYLEYSYVKGEIEKENYLTLFHILTTQRAALGQTHSIEIDTPENPLNGHRAFRTTLGGGYKEGEKLSYLGFRTTYHSLEDSPIGFLRGTQIEFLNLLLSYNKTQKLDLEYATLISIVSLAQRSEFFSGFSWRMKLGWDREYLEDKSHFTTRVGFGYSFGNEFAYSYLLLDPLLYVADEVEAGLGLSMGVVLDKYKFTQTNIEGTLRRYSQSREQYILNVTQSFRVSQNLQLQAKYNYINRYNSSKKYSEERYDLLLNYYF